MANVSVRQIAALILINVIASLSSIALAQPDKSEKFAPRAIAPLTKSGAATAVTPVSPSDTPAGKTLESGAASRVGKIAPRVPQVVGTLYSSAEQVLHRLGYKPKAVFLEQPDPALRYGYVRQTSPVAGTSLAVGSTIELRIPRASPRVGIGALGASDVGRRAGFDLDQGRYEEIYRGADILLRVSQNTEPYIDQTDGRKYFKGGGAFIEPSDGAAIKLVDARHVPYGPGGVGSYNYFVLCSSEFQKNAPPTERIEILSRMYAGSDVTLCVYTSQKQISVVQFRGGENSNIPSDYKFHHAIFPPQPVAMQQQIRK